MVTMCQFIYPVDVASHYCSARVCHIVLCLFPIIEQQFRHILQANFNQHLTFRQQILNLAQCFELTSISFILESTVVSPSVVTTNKFL
jgi:hypothetical protein